MDTAISSRAAIVDVLAHLEILFLIDIGDSFGSPIF